MSSNRGNGGGGGEILLPTKEGNEKWKERINRKELKEEIDQMGI